MLSCRRFLPWGGGGRAGSIPGKISCRAQSLDRTSLTSPTRREFHGSLRARRSFRCGVNAGPNDNLVYECMFALVQTGRLFIRTVSFFDARITLNDPTTIEDDLVFDQVATFYESSTRIISPTVSSCANRGKCACRKNHHTAHQRCQVPNWQMKARGIGADACRAAAYHGIKRDGGADTVGALAEPQATTFAERLQFDETTITIWFDGKPHHVDNPKSFALYRHLAEQAGTPITKQTLRAKDHQFRGDKTVPNARNALPKTLQKTVRSSRAGYWLHLPASKNKSANDRT